MISAFLAAALLSQADIQLDRSANGTNVVRVVGGQGHTVAVYVGSDLDAKLPSMLGTATKDGRDLVFVPRFPFEPGREYRVEVSGEPRVTKLIRIPDVARVASTSVQAIYPTRNQLPANQLKLYFEFSAPMSRSDAYRHIRLFDESGKEVEHAFLELGEELWDARQTRFTLLFDPGRIKRDLVPNLDDGTPLQAGRRYELRVDAKWLDANGVPLKNDATKQFAVVAADRSEPDPTKWTIHAPTSNSRNPLIIDFAEPMDYGLLLHTLAVKSASGNSLKGTIAVEREEQRWLFTPQEAWTSGNYTLAVDGTLEDLAGNRIGRLFEVDTRVSKEMARRPSGTSASLEFVVR